MYKFRNKKFVILSITIFLILAGILFSFVILNKPSYIKLKDIETYCIQHSSNNAKSFFIKQEGNYYFCVSKDGDPNINPEFIIFRKEKNNKISFFGGIEGKKTRTNAYLMYLSDFPDASRKNYNNSMIFFSDNRENMKKAIIEINENGELKTEVYNLDPNEPFIIKIELVNSKNYKRFITDYHFYNMYGEEVDESLYKATIN